MKRRKSSLKWSERGLEIFSAASVTSSQTSDGFQDTIVGAQRNWKQNMSKRTRAEGKKDLRSISLHKIMWLLCLFDPTLEESLGMNWRERPSASSSRSTRTKSRKAKGKRHRETSKSKRVFAKSSRSWKEVACPNTTTIYSWRSRFVILWRNMRRTKFEWPTSSIWSTELSKILHMRKLGERLRQETRWE